MGILIKIGEMELTEVNAGLRIILMVVLVLGGLGVVDGGAWLESFWRLR
jgi:hypothetical protein